MSDSFYSKRPLHFELQSSRVDYEGVLAEYVKDAELQRVLQKIAKAIIFCIVGCVVMSFLCMSNPQFQNSLFAFFRLLIVPIKPLLVAKPSYTFGAFWKWLQFFCNLFNFLVFPVVVFFALKTAKLPIYLYFARDGIYQLERQPYPTENRYKVMWVGDHTYAILGFFPFANLEDIEIVRPKGKKSSADYIFRFQFSDAEFKFRWGDMINVAARNAVLSKLEKVLPERIDSGIFEPFKLLPQRQSYTELWLQELSGAPRRDKLTPLAEGARLDKGNYTILHKAGVGGQGVVYFAESFKHKRMVVLKEFVLPLYPDIRVRKKAAERFQSEASMLSRLQHPQIAKYYDLFLEDHRAYLVLEHIEGKTLKQLVMSQGKMSETQVLGIAKQIAEILQYLHSQDPPVVHRDLTPDNIMLGEDGLCKLIDFSVAQELSTGVTGSVVGKPNYISPEQFRGKPNTQSDIYSLGATLYFLLTAKDPPPITVLHPAKENEGISSSLDLLISKCTGLELDKRLQNAGQILELLDGDASQKLELQSPSRIELS